MPLSVGNLLMGSASQSLMSSIASSYASVKQDALTFGYDGSVISSIDGSAIAGGGGGGDTSQCMPKSASSDFILTSQSSQFITSTAGLQPSGDYAFNSALSSYLPKSASGDFAPSGDYAYNSALSAYAYESSVSAWTAKQDALTFGYSGSYISSINGSAIVDTTAGGGAGVVTATGGSNGYVTSINGSGLSGAGGGGGGGGDDYVPKSSTEVAIGSGCTANYTSFAQGVNVSATIGSVAFGSGATASSYSFAANGLAYAETNSVAMANASAIKTSMAVGGAGASSGAFAQGNGVHASGYSFAQGKRATASATSFAQGDSASAFNQSFALGQYCSSTSYGFAQGNNCRGDVNALAQGYSSRAYTDSLAQGWSCSASATSFAQGYKCYANNNSFAQGNYISALNTAVVFGTYNKCKDGDCTTGDSAAFVIGDGTASSDKHDLMVVTKDGELTLFSGTADTSGVSLVSTLRGLSSMLTAMSALTTELSGWATSSGWTGME